jgi:hypothetical protein
LYLLFQNAHTSRNFIFALVGLSERRIQLENRLPKTLSVVSMRRKIWSRLPQRPLIVAQTSGRLARHNRITVPLDVLVNLLAQHSTFAKVKA